MAPIQIAPILVRAESHLIVNVPPYMLDVWIYVNLVFNTILLPVLVLTFLFCERARRTPSLVNVCITWIYSGIVSLLLFYAGQHKGLPPNHTLCTIQTSLMHGMPPLWSVAILVMTYHINASIVHGPSLNPPRKMRQAFLLGAPYIAQMSFTIATLAVSINNPADVNREFRTLYCTLRSQKLYLATLIFTFIMCIGIISIKIQMLMTVFKIRRAARQGKSQQQPVDPALVARIILFGVFVLAGIISNLVSLIDPSTIVQDVYAAFGGAFVFLIFGSQIDVLRVWCFWRKNSGSSSTHSINDTSSNNADLKNQHPNHEA